MKYHAHSVLIVSLLVFCAVLVEARPLQLPAIQVAPIEDSASGRDYEFNLKLPEGYEAKRDKAHPIIYFVDALWNREVISGSIEYFLDDAILVGISWELGVKPERSRLGGYTPDKTTKQDYKHTTGKVHEHLAFLQNDIFKYVEPKYKVGPTRRTYYGFSVGGTFGSYILLTQPATFENAILGSPPMLFGGHYTYEYEPFSNAIPEILDANIFVSEGAKEKPEYIEHALGLIRFLKSRTTSSSQVAFRVIESADHGKAFSNSALQSLSWLAKISS